MKDFPIEISLNYPVEAFGEQISKLVIKRRPTTKDLKAMDAATGEIAKTAALVARLCEVPPATIDQMDAADFTRAADMVQDFLS
jgi:hypothetical protein